MKLFRTAFIFFIYLFTFNISGQEFQTYKNTEYFYSINFPKGWKYYEPHEYYHVVRCEFRENDSLSNVADGQINIMVLKLEQDTELEEIVKQYINVIQIIGKDITEIKKEEKELNGHKSIYHVYTYNMKNKNFPDRQIDVRFYLQKDKLQYLVCYTGKEEIYKKYKDIINNSLESFQLLQ